MSELLNGHEDRKTIRRHLLATVSMLTLFGVGAMQARADDHPLVWIELDGQFAQTENSVEAFSPLFLATSPFDLGSHLGVEQAPHALWNEGAKLSFLPPNSDLVFSASILYGKNTRHARLERHPTTANLTKYNGRAAYSAFQNLATQSSEQHTILDFQVGKDFGLGMFGHGGSSVFSLGIRFAQFNSKNSAAFQSQPTNVNSYAPFKRFYASLVAQRKFSGIGPSLSWDASARLLGSPASGSLAFDWGLKAALLFGRQRVSGHQQRTEYPFNSFFHSFSAHTAVYHQVSPIARSKNAVVPNVGGFGGVSWRYPNAKVSLGYRADFFFGALDGGIDTARRENVGFYGPFASVSIGVGG